MQKLRWDICSVTPYDFLPYLLNKLNLINHRNIGNIRHYLSTFISTCATEFKFSMLPSSMIASGCLFATIKSLNTLTSSQCEQILQDIHEITGIDLECLRECVEQVEEFIETNLKISFNQIQNKMNSAVKCDSAAMGNCLKTPEEMDSMICMNDENFYDEAKLTSCFVSC